MISTIQKTRKLVMPAIAAGLCLISVLAAQPSAAEPAFTFRQAEFMHQDDAMKSATAFVAGQLPAGLPMAEATARLSRADMDCRPDGAAGATACSFAMIAGRDGGSLGDDTWTVRLTCDPQGKLVVARLDHERTGW